MSSEAVGWVFRYSPYRGATLAVHLAVGDSANDQNWNEIWMAMGRLADKARVDRGTAVRAVAQLVSDGYLEVLEDHRHDRAGRPSRYRMLWPDVDVVFDTRRPGGVAPRNTPAEAEGCAPTQQGVLRHATGGVAPRNTNPSTTQEVTQGVTPHSPPERQPTFDDFWSVYPRCVGKRAARRAWDAAVKRAEPRVICNGAWRYARDPNREPAYTAHPSTWLNQDRWEDDPLPPRADRGPAGRMDRSLTAADRFVAMAEHREGVDGGSQGLSQGAAALGRGVPH